MRVAIVHDALCTAGGAERVVLWMTKAFPDAPIFTSAYLPNCTFNEFRQLDVRTLPHTKRITSEKQFKSWLPLWFFLIRQLDFRNYDVVLSSSTYLAKYIRPPRNVTHKAYIHAPFRLLWKPESYTSDSIPSPIIFKPILSLALPILRKLDQKFTQQIPAIATSCNNVAEEIWRIYHRASTVIHPPVSVDDYPLATSPGEYYLSVSRLISHKRVDLAIQACTRMKKKLIVVGDGPERKNLEKLAGETIRFVGRVNDEQLKTLYLDSKALLFPSHEDYGIVPLEAQACGRPVIAYGKGGALETVSEGKSGVFFSEQSVDSLVASMLDFEKMKFRPHQIRKWVDQFDVKYFISELRNFIELE